MSRSANPLTIDASERQSIAALFRQLSDDVTHLARSEVKLARAEVTANVHALIRPVILILVAALLGVAALFTLMGAFVGFLTPLVGSAGLAALIVAAVIGGAAFLLLQSGLGGLGKVTVMPTRAVRSVNSDVSAVKAGLA